MMLIGLVLGVFVIGYALVTMMADYLRTMNNPQGGGGFDDEMHAREHIHNLLLYGALIGMDVC